MIACFNYLNHQSVAETILVMDNGSHYDAILNEFRFVGEKFKGLAQRHAMQKERMPVYF
jgi:hypothetical protein